MEEKCRNIQNIIIKIAFQRHVKESHKRRINNIKMADSKKKMPKIKFQIKLKLENRSQNIKTEFFKQLLLV